MAYRPAGRTDEPLRRTRPKTGGGGGARARRPQKKRRGLRRFVKWTLGCFLFLILVGIGAFVVLYQTTDIPSANPVAVSQTSVITYNDGKTPMGRIASENRENVDLNRVPKHVQHAVLAAENRDFYSDPGFSVSGYFRAAWAIIRGQDLQGGSTITQQLVKKTYLTDERTFTRKFKELILSVKLERQLSKDQILERYLNTVYYGRGAYGIQTASKAYFNKDVSSLSTGEAAVLASVIRNPSLYDPERNPDNLENRYHYVLGGMQAKGWLTGAKPPEHFPKVTANKRQNQYRGQNGYLIQMVKEELERRGISEDELLTGGYRVTTTFDPRLMRVMTKSVRDNLPTNLKKDGVDVGAASIEPGTGKVVAIYGGQGYLKQQLNNATSGGLTQPGSSFKPYVLATALQQGISLNTTFNGTSPQTIDGHSFRNSGGSSYGYVNMQTATQKSINTAYLEMGQEAGLQNIVDNAKKVGYETSPWCKPGKNATHIAPVTSLPLGPMDVCPLAQAGGIATFANQGTFVEPTTIAKVTNSDGSKTVYDGKPAESKVFSKGVAADTLYGMSKVADAGGTAPGARLPDRPIAGKTGTSSQNRSAWFVGTIPQMTTTVAMYKAEGGKLPTSSGEIFGGRYPASIWHDYMVKATQNMDVEQFPKPAFVGTVKHSHPTGLPTKTKDPSKTPSGSPSESPSQTPSEEPSTKSPVPSNTKTGLPTKTPRPTTTKCNPLDPTCNGGGNGKDSTSQAPGGGG